MFSQRLSLPLTKIPIHFRKQNCEEKISDVYIE